MTKKLKPWQWIVLALVLAFALDWLIQRPDARTRELNQALAEQGSAQLKAYPYQFHVLRVEGDTAVIATPRNFDVPAFHALGVLYPQLNVKNNNDPAFIAAQQALGAVQAEARLIVLARPGIKSMRWELDKAWLTAHDIDIPEK